MGKQWKQCQTLFWGAPKSLQMVTAAMKLKDAYSLEKKIMTNLNSIFKSRHITLPTKVRLVKAMVFPVDQPRQHIKKQRHYFANKGLSSQSYGFSSTYVQM